MDSFSYMSILTTLFATLVHLNKAEIFSSMSDMETLIRTEQEVLTLLQSLRDRETRKLNAALGLAL